MTALSPIITDPVRTFCPWVDDAQHALRCRLVKAGNFADSRGRFTESANARGLYHTIALVAGAWKFAPASNDDLKDVADALVRLAIAAQTFERLEVPDGE